MSNNKRVSESYTVPWTELPTPVSVPASDSEKWSQDWQGVFARGKSESIHHLGLLPTSVIYQDLIDSRIVSLDAETSVEDACDVSGLTSPVSHY